MVDPKDRQIKKLEELIERQSKTIESLNVANRKLKSTNKKYKDALIKINGVSMRTINDE